MSAIEDKLAEHGITLPDTSAAPMAAGNYMPHVVSGNMIYVSGQISRNPDDSPLVGKLGDTFSTEEGATAARTCAVQLLAQAKFALNGDLDRLKRVVKLTGFVNSTQDFTDQPKVINGCSDLLVDVLGDAGRHARSAVSAPSLPLGVAVEIEGIFEIK